VHVEHDRSEAKYWLAPARLQESRGFKRNELRRIARIIEAHQDQLMESWDEYFGG
jgi:hypothetical protein